MNKKYIITEDQKQYLYNTLITRKRVNEIYSEISNANKKLYESNLKVNSTITILEKHKRRGNLNENVINGLIDKKIPKKYFIKLKLIK